MIVGSDKINLTDHTGSKSAHPLYVSIGNIPKATRLKHSERAFLLLAYIPDCSFKQTEFGTKEEY